jgi:hypothetical protein
MSDSNNTMFRLDSATDLGWSTPTHLMGWEMPLVQQNRLVAADTIEDYQNALYSILYYAPVTVHAALWLMALLKRPVMRPKAVKHPGNVTHVKLEGPAKNRIVVSMERGGYELRVKVAQTSKGPQKVVMAERVW